MLYNTVAPVNIPLPPDQHHISDVARGQVGVRELRASVSNSILSYTKSWTPVRLTGLT